MSLRVYDYTGAEKNLVRFTEASFTHTTGGDTTAEVVSPAQDFGSVELGDLVRLPYPYPEADGDLFRVKKIDVDGDAMTLSARHRTADFELAFLIRWASTSRTLQNLVTLLNDAINATAKADAGQTLTPAEQTVYESWAISNARGITFGFWKHDNADGRYSTAHQTTMRCLPGADLIDKVRSVYGCTVIRDGTQLVLTYGTESEYFRNKFSLPPYSPIFRSGSNVAGYSMADDDALMVTTIYAYADLIANTAEGESVEYFCGCADTPGLTVDVSRRHAIPVKYETDISPDDYSSWELYRQAVVADVLAKAANDISAQANVTQNITVEVVPGGYLFGGETALCGDALTESDFSLAVLSFKLNVETLGYEAVEMGRVTPELSELSSSSASGGGSSTGGDGAGKENIVNKSDVTITSANKSTIKYPTTNAVWNTIGNYVNNAAFLERTARKTDTVPDNDTQSSSLYPSTKCLYAMVHPLSVSIVSLSTRMGDAEGDISALKSAVTFGPQAVGSVNWYVRKEKISTGYLVEMWTRNASFSEGDYTDTWHGEGKSFTPTSGSALQLVRFKDGRFVLPVSLDIPIGAWSSAALGDHTVGQTVLSSSFDKVVVRVREFNTNVSDGSIPDPVVNIYVCGVIL